MAGRAAEEILLKGNYTQGAHGDLSSATNIATEMLTRYGMGDELVSIEYIPGSTGSDKINQEVSVIIKRALAEARKLLVKNKKFLELLSNELLKCESLEYEEIDSLYKKKIKKNR